MSAGQGSRGGLPYGRLGCLGLVLVFFLGFGAVFAVIGGAAGGTASPGGGSQSAAPSAAVPSAPASAEAPSAAASPVAATAVPAVSVAPVAEPTAAGTAPAINELMPLAPSSLAVAQSPGVVRVTWTQPAGGVEPDSFVVTALPARVLATVPYEAGVAGYGADLPPDACGTLEVTVSAVSGGFSMPSAPLAVEASPCG